MTLGRFQIRQAVRSRHRHERRAFDGGYRIKSCSRPARRRCGPLSADHIVLSMPKTVLAGARVALDSLDRTTYCLEHMTSNSNAPPRGSFIKKVQGDSEWKKQ